MQTVESLKRKIKSAEDLQSVVRTMKALAAVSIRQYQRAVESLVEYNKTVEMGLQVVLKQKLDSTGAIAVLPLQRLGAVIFGSDQGLCGQLNEQIANHALSETDALRVGKNEREVITVGQRANDYVIDGGQPVSEILTNPSSTSGITPAVQDIIMIIEEWHVRRNINHVYLFYNEYLTGASYRPHTVHLLPVDRIFLEILAKEKWPSKILPGFTMNWNALFSGLIREYLFVSLYRAFAESLASENASRLASMQNAEKNIEERLQELFGQFHRQRQMTITEELLDIVSGFEALKGKKSS